LGFSFLPQTPYRNTPNLSSQTAPAGVVARARGKKEGEKNAQNP